MIQDADNKFSFAAPCGGVAVKPEPKISAGRAGAGSDCATLDNPSPEISVLVRSCNDAAFVGMTIKMLLAQRGVTFEIVSCDDNSTDGTCDILAAFSGLVKVPRPDGRYIPGRTLNHAVRSCRGNIVVFNNADAIPQSCDYLTLLTAPLTAPAVAAVYGNQLSRPDAQMLVRKDNERIFGDGRLAEKWGNVFSLAASAIRRERLLQYPFDETIQYSEDIEWAARARARGEKIVYVESAKVEHSHNYTLRQLRKRFYNEGRAEARIFGTAPELAVCLRQIAMETLRDFRYLFARRAFSEMPLAPLRRIIQKYSRYRGAHDGLKMAQKEEGGHA